MNNKQEAILKYMMLNCPPPFDFIYFLEDDINLVFYYGNKTKLNIPNNYQKTPIREINSTCFAANDDITKVKIPEGITAIY